MKPITLTQTEARAALRAVMADAKPPRVIYAKPDGRERIVHVVRVLRSVLPGRKTA